MKSSTASRSTSARKKRRSPALPESSSPTKHGGTAKSTQSSLDEWRASHGRKRGKYNNVRTMYKGLRFDSKAELNRWQQLEQLLEVGAIRDLRHHTRFPLIVNNVKIATYECDAEYWMDADCAHVVEDTKGVRTAAYRLKEKLLKACWGIDIQEIKA
ncbi:MAG: DUF1064 domain-containing protein [Candidatus Micrarchaeota archaeon]|nr:DUF1064 domain-containing protein [Candidatus Micrarchaeota archaeon]